MTADSESCEIYHVSAMCLSAVSPIQSTPGESPEEPSSPSGCEDVTHLQPQWWRLSSLFTPLKTNKQTNKVAKKKTKNPTQD